MYQYNRIHTSLWSCISIPIVELVFTYDQFAGVMVEKYVAHICPDEYPLETIRKIGRIGSVQ